jgi:hypothetical protein
MNLSQADLERLKMIALSILLSLQPRALMLRGPRKSSEFGAILWLISGQLHHEKLTKPVSSLT